MTWKVIGAVGAFLTGIASFIALISLIQTSVTSDLIEETLEKSVIPKIESLVDDKIGNNEPDDRGKLEQRISNLESVLSSLEKRIANKPTDQAGSGLSSTDEEASLEEPVSSEVETRSRTFQFRHQNNHCQGPHRVEWRISADSGWEIEPNSVDVRVTEKSSKSSYSGVKDSTSQGFTIVGNIVNNGQCVRVLGKTIARDGRGALGVRGTYVERKDSS